MLLSHYGDRQPLKVDTINEHEIQKGPSGKFRAPWGLAHGEGTFSFLSVDSPQTNLESSVVF
jgi:hypothetical protein